MGNNPVRAGFTSHHAATWDWDAAIDPLQISIHQVPKEPSNYVLRINIPFGHGVCREDIRLILKDHVLTIYGKRPLDKEITSQTLKQLFARYSQYTSFERSLRLPSFIDPSTLQAGWVQNGLLEILATKSDQQGGGAQERELQISDVPALKDSKYLVPMVKDLQFSRIMPSEAEGAEEETKEEKKSKSQSCDNPECPCGSNCKCGSTCQCGKKDTEDTETKKETKTKSPTTKSPTTKSPTSTKESEPKSSAPKESTTKSPPTKEQQSASKPPATTTAPSGKSQGKKKSKAKKK